MDVLRKMIGRMSKEEVRFFKIYATRMIDAGGRKDLTLFDKIRTRGSDFDDTLLARKLYGKTTTSYYRLKHRLTEDLGDYMLLHCFDKHKVNALNREWALYNVYLAKGDLELAFHYLNKAEKKAIELENWEMLDMIYAGYVRLSTGFLEINPENYIAKWKANAEKLNLFRQMDQTIAALSHRLRITQNLTREDSSLTSVLNQTLSEFAAGSDIESSLGFQTRIYRAVSQVLLQHHSYKELSEYVIKVYQEFGARRWFKKDNHDIKLQMLTYIANAFYRLGNFKQSLEYSMILGDEINSYNRALYDKYVFFYYNTMVLNYMKTDLPKALSIISNMESEMKQRKISYYDQFIYVNKAIAYHWLNKPDMAIRTLVRLYMLDSFSKADEGFRLKIVIAELIMHFDAGEVESFAKRLKLIRKEYNHLLTTDAFARERTLFELMEYMQVTPHYKRDEEFLKKARLFIKEGEQLGEDESSLIEYSLWLRTKIN